SPKGCGEARTAHSGQRPYENHQRLPVLLVEAARPVPSNAAQLRARRGAVSGRAISQHRPELRQHTGNTRHWIRSAPCTPVESTAVRADGNGASFFLSLPETPRIDRSRSCFLRPQCPELVPFHASEIFSGGHGGTRPGVLRSHDSCRPAELCHLAAARQAGRTRWRSCCVA